MPPEPIVANVPDEAFIVRKAARLLAEPAKLERRLLERLSRAASRYGHLKDLLEGHADNNLTVALARLQDDGLIEQQVDIQQRPAVRMYVVTPYGQSVLDTISRMHQAATGSLALVEATPPPAREAIVWHSGSPRSGESALAASEVCSRLGALDVGCDVLTADPDGSWTEPLLKRLDAGLLAFVILTGKARTKRERMELEILMSHLQDHPDDWRRHYFLVRKDVPFTSLAYASQDDRRPRAPLNVIVWNHPREAGRAAAGLVSAKLSTGGNPARAPSPKTSTKRSSRRRTS